MLALAVGPKGRGAFCNTQIISPMYNVVRAIMAAEAGSTHLLTTSVFAALCGHTQAAWAGPAGYVKWHGRCSWGIDPCKPPQVTGNCSSSCLFGQQQVRAERTAGGGGDEESGYLLAFPPNSSD